MHGHALTPILGQILKEMVFLTLVSDKRLKVRTSSYYTLKMDMQEQRDSKSKSSALSHLISTTEAG